MPRQPEGVAVFLHALGKFDQNAAGRLGVQEGDFAVAGTHARGLVDEGHAFFLQFGQCLCGLFPGGRLPPGMLPPLPR